MRTCLLRAGLSRAPGSSQFVLGNPKGWLGTTYHEVLERIAGVDSKEETLNDAVERLWNEAIEKQYQRSQAHSLDSRFGSPTGWPGYFVARASVSLRAKDLIAESAATRPSTPKLTAGPAHDGSIREHEFTSFDGKLRGRPDVIRADEVVDYKSGAITEYDEATQAPVIKAAYIRQLRIYGFLVKDALGKWPKRGVLLPLAGVGVDITLDPSDCIREATDAVALLDAYNSQVRSDADIEKFASPSPDGCRWCSYKLVCPSFWRVATPEWSGQLDGAAVQGVLATEPMDIHSGAAKAISLDIHVGSEPSRRVQITPLHRAIHVAVNTIAAGDCVRFVGLRARPDGTLAPTQRTVLARTAELPSIVVRSDSHL